MELVGQSVFGGALIGLALAALMVLTGRVVSASDMIGSLLGGREGLAATSIAFIAGLFIAPSILIAFGAIRPPISEPGWLFLVCGGLLVGIGARLGNISLFGAILGVTRRPERAFAALAAIATGVGVALTLVHLLHSGWMP
jgi:uncharacterized protein